MNSGIKIALAGPMRSGKDTVGDLLIEGLQKRHGWFERIAFADPIKAITKEYFPDTLKEGKPRRHYIEIGELFRSLDPDVWVKYLINEIDFILRDPLERVSNVLVTDLRRQNEYDALKAAGFTVVKVTASDEIRKKRIEEKGEKFVPEEFYHPTETGIKHIPYDYIIMNDGDRKELIEKVDELLELFNSKREEETS